MLILNEREVVELLDPDGCRQAMAEALASLARGEVHQPLRFVVRPPGETSLVGLMPAHRAGPAAAYSLKTVCVFPENPQRGLDAHQGLVCLFDGETGRLEVVMNASPVTAIRTAAVTAVATKALARDDAQELAIVGAGVQARAHLRALDGFERVRIASRTEEHARTLARATGAEACSTVEEAVRDADVVVLATNASEPVLRREWLKPGAHVSAVGMGKELDDATLADATLFVDTRASAEVEGGIPPELIHAELGEVLIGEQAGRTSPDELTAFRSLGLAVEDLFAAEYVVRRARDTGMGTTLDF